MRSLGILVTIFLALGILGCGCINYPPPEGSSAGPATTPLGTFPQLTRPVIASGRVTPSVFIITPPFDGGILTGNVTIIVEIANFTLSPPGGASVPGTGHLIYYRDVVPVTVQANPAFTRPGTYAVSSATTYTWVGITPGTHTFAVQLVNSDDTPLDPPIVDAIDVTAVPPEIIASP